MGDLLLLTLGPRKSMVRGTRAVDWYDRGCAFEQARRFDEAIAAYLRALAGWPELADANNNLGHMLHERGDLAAAESHYRLALCGDPNIALFWFNLGVVIEDLGRRAEAIAAYERALELDPEFADSHYNLARLYQGMACTTHDELVMRRAIRHLASYRRLAGSQVRIR